MAPPLIEFGHASIAISLLMGILCVGRIRSYDVHGKAPYLKLFLVAVYGGVVAAAASLLLSAASLHLGLRILAIAAKWLEGRVSEGHGELPPRLQGPCIFSPYRRARQPGRR